MARKWQFIESRNRVFCNGRCVTGHNLSIFFLALILIFVTTGLFFGYDCPYLSERLSPVIPIAPAILFLTAICCIFRTACTDPGILPRATADEVAYLDKLSNTQTVALTGRVMDIRMHSGHTVQLKFCQTCKIFRPPRVSHCSLCNACIVNFDHHCPWVGNCVGLRNYRYFYLFLFSISLLCIYVFVFNIVNIALRAQNNSTVADAIRQTPATMVEAIICFFSIWSVIGLWGYHTYLICRSVTTNEDIKDTWNAQGGDENVINPYSRGNGCLNCFATLCGPLPPSFLNLRAVVKENKNIPLTPMNVQGLATSSPEDNRERVGTSNNPQQHRYVPREYV